MGSHRLKRLPGTISDGVLVVITRRAFSSRNFALEMPDLLGGPGGIDNQRISGTLGGHQRATPRAPSGGPDTPMLSQDGRDLAAAPIRQIGERDMVRASITVSI